MESLRLFLFMPNTAFVIAADEDMVRHAVKEYFNGIDEKHITDYLDKLIQFPVKVLKLVLVKLEHIYFYSMHQFMKLMESKSLK